METRVKIQALTNAFTIQIDNNQIQTKPQVYQVEKIGSDNNFVINIVNVNNNNFLIENVRIDQIEVNDIIYTTFNELSNILTPILYNSGFGGNAIENGKYIPLTGTESNKPVTGDIELNNSVENRLIKGKVQGSYISFLDDGVISINKNSGSNVNIAGIDIIGKNANEKGIEGLHYYGNNYVDNSFVQKKYVDENNFRVTEYKGFLKIEDEKPTIAGLYKLIEFGAYNNLTPAVNSSGNSTTIITESGFINEAYFDGTNFIQIKNEFAIGGIIDSKVENLEKATRSFLSGATTENVFYTPATATPGSLKDDGTITNSGIDANNKIITLDLGDALHVQIKAYPFQSLLPEYAMFVGIRANGDTVELLPPQPNSTIFGTYEIDVSSFVTGKVCYNYTFGETTTLVTVTKAVNGAVEDGIKMYIDDGAEPVLKVLKFFTDGVPIYDGSVAVDTTGETTSSLQNNNTQPGGSAKSKLNILTNGKKFFHYEALRTRELAGNVNTYVSLLGITAANTYVSLLPSSDISNNEGLYTAEINIEAYTKISYAHTDGLAPNFFMHDGITSRVIGENSVKEYVDNVASSGGAASKQVDLYALGLRENKTSAENSAIFNQAFIQAKSQKKSILIPPGQYSVDNIQIKGGVGFTGFDKDTVLRATGANPIFNYAAAEAQSYIEANQLGTAENCNQGVEIGHFILSGNGVGTKGMVLNQMAYSNFERVYMVGFTEVCMDLKGVLLCNFYDVQFTRSANGIRSRISDNGSFWSNLNNFDACKWRYLSGIGIDWSEGTGLFLTGCDISAVGTAGNSATGSIKLRRMSEEAASANSTGVDFTMKNCWTEIANGGFWLDMSGCAGKSSLTDVNVIYGNGVGNLSKGIINTQSNLILINSAINNLNIETNSGTTKNLNSKIGSHTETGSGTYTLIG